MLQSYIKGISVEETISKIDKTKTLDDLTTTYNRHNLSKTNPTINNAIINKLIYFLNNIKDTYHIFSRISTFDNVFHDILFKNKELSKLYKDTVYSGIVHITNNSERLHYLKSYAYLLTKDQIKLIISDFNTNTRINIHKNYDIYNDVELENLINELENPQERFDVSYNIGLTKLVKELLDNKKLYIDPTVNRNSPIRWASEKGYVEIVKILLAQKNVNPADMANSALKNACEYGQLEVVKLLMNDSRLDPGAFDNKGLRWAIQMKKTNIIKLLLTDKRVTDNIDKLEKHQLEYLKNNFLYNK
jgi:hypothetical protein